MPSLLRKLSMENKSKDHLKALESRMELWQSGNLLVLFQESLRSLKFVCKAKTDFYKIYRRDAKG